MNGIMIRKCMEKAIRKARPFRWWVLVMCAIFTFIAVDFLYHFGNQYESTSTVVSTSARDRLNDVVVPGYIIMHELHTRYDLGTSYFVLLMKLTFPPIFLRKK
jgi:hypothetical protein